jgi:hypothetical protein
VPQVWTAVIRVHCRFIANPKSCSRATPTLILRIPMMSISHSDLMPIRSERSDAGLSQCEIVIDIRQDFSLFSLI